MRGRVGLAASRGTGTVLDYLLAAARLINENRRVLWVWPAVILAASWVGDIASFVAAIGEPGAGRAPVTIFGLLNVAARAATEAVQPWPIISPLWGLLPAMTNPLILIVLANITEVAVAAASAALLQAYLRSALRPIRSQRWLAGVPGTWLIFMLTLTWFRLFGPLRDVFAVLTGLAPGEGWALIWQLFALAAFVPVMFSVYLVVLAKTDWRRAAAASTGFLRSEFSTVTQIFGPAAVIFFLPAFLGRLVAPGSPAGLAMTFIADFIRVAAGFWLATAWLILVERRADYTHGRRHRS